MLNKSFKLFIMISFVFNQACASHNTPFKSPLDTRSSYKYHIYGKLEKTKDGYEFTDFSNRYANGQSWVRLADLKPMWSTVSEKCTMGLISSCKSANEKHFREKKLNISGSGIAGYVVVACCTVGLGFLAPPAIVRFDQKEYDQAVKSAVNKVNVSLLSSGETISDIVIAYNNNMSSLKKAYQNMNAECDRLSSEYNERIKEFRINVSINDISGLCAEKPSTFKPLISINRNKIRSLESFETIESKTIGVVRTHSIGDFNKLVTQETNSLLQGDWQKLKIEWKKASSYYTIQCRQKARIHSQDGQKYLLNYKIIAPQTVKFDQNSRSVNATVKIFSVDCHKVHPDTIMLADKKIELNYSGDVINIANKTRDYLNVDSISFYYDTKIVSRYKLQSEVPPNGTIELIPFSALPVEWEKLLFTEVTKQKAKSKNIEFGFAVKYRHVNTDKQLVLYSTKKYNLFDIIAD